MNNNNTIKVIGYSQKLTFDTGIEIRNFNPDTVGVQLASAGGTPLFTMGNFSITTNMDPKIDKTFITNKFSPFMSLDDLTLTIEETQTLLSDNAEVFLNLDKSNLKYYALFGSLTEFIRITLEDIIIKWPASLYANPVAQTDDGITLNGFTYEDYTYDFISDISTFRINTTFLNNKFQLNFLKNGTIIDSFSSTNDLRNVTVNYLSYVIFRNNIEYPVIGFTGSTYKTSDYVYLNVKGDPFSGQPASYKTLYHIKPNKTYENKFFNGLPDFGYYLLNRRITPIYTATFSYPVKTEEGTILYRSDVLTWPVSDGYNIDFDTTAYVDYVSKLVQIATNNDLYISNLMTRFLVTESISDFDTVPVHLDEAHQDTSGQKMNKTLQLYGHEFDKINNFITGIAFANTVTYNRQDNTPDVYLKQLAEVMGWGLISSIMENNLLSNYVTVAPSEFEGESVGLTAVEADIELWRRIILNTPWIWKSKGARKSIEFLLRFIGAPQGLVKFNEYIYLADAPIDIELFRQTLELNGLDTDLSVYPIDDEGYPSPFRNTENMYYQNDGRWYRETGGSGSTIDILTGNNPHVGPYDGGSRYINQFKTLIPNFSAVTITSQITTNGIVNLFTNNQLGTYDGTAVSSTVDTVHLTGLNGEDLSNCYVFSATAVSDIVHPGIILNGCGCPCEGDDNVLSICVSENLVGSVKPPCEPLIGSPSVNTNGIYVFNYYQYNQDGSVFSNSNGPIPLTSIYTPSECCKKINGTPALYTVFAGNIATNTGYICCSTKERKCGCFIACTWGITSNGSTSVLLPLHTTTYDGQQEPYLEFTRPDGSKAVVTPDGCNCYGRPYTETVPNVTDPYTGEIGYACKLTKEGVGDLQLGVNSVIYTFYRGRVDGRIGCLPKI